MSQKEKRIPTLVPLDAPFIDARGMIQNILHEQRGSTVIITTEANTVRANHRHREDNHFCMCLSGMVEYYERQIGSKLTPKCRIFRPYQLFYTPAMVDHAMRFPVKTVLLVLGNRHRSPEDYEKDLIRLDHPLIEPRTEDELHDYVPPVDEVLLQAASGSVGGPVPGVEE